MDERSACNHRPRDPLAKQWDGWGTALKPSHEPICVARKPIVGTVAANVIEHGTGAINIDACRVGTENTIRPNGPIGFHGGGSGGIGGSNSGRWPANFIHDGSDEVVELFPGEDGKSAARFFYCAKCSNADRDEGLEGFAKTNVRANNHPTVKPTALMRYLVRLVTPPGGTVLDPFLGSGSTGKACALEGFSFVGFDLSDEYVAIAKARIKAAKDSSNQ